MMQQKKSLHKFPLALFSSVMGYFAVAIVIRNLENLYEIENYISMGLLILSIILFVFNGYVLVYRLIYHLKDVQKDFNDPVQMNFFASISISLLLFAVLLIDIWASLSFVIWLIGAIMQLSLTLIFLTKLTWDSSIRKAHFTPVSFIPIVGNLVVPIAGSFHVATEINWFFFGIGIFFSIVYITMFMNRMFFDQPIPEMLFPALFILLAPPSVGFVSYMSIVGELDHFAYLLFGLAFFIALFLLFQLKRILQVPFFVSWWSLLFPSAAFTIATIRMFNETGNVYFEWIFLLQLFGLVVLVIYLTSETIKFLRQ